MNFLLAIKAFFKALKEPEKAEEFCSSKQLTLATNDLSHLRFLSLLQQSSRLIDFLKEDIASFTDAQVGAAVRKIHQDASKSLEELVTIRPVMEGSEGTKIEIPVGYDPLMIKVIGKVNGEPPYSGILIHKGWKAHKRSLPKKIGEQPSDIICPAEVELR